MTIGNNFFHWIFTEQIYCHASLEIPKNRGSFIIGKSTTFYYSVYTQICLVWSHLWEHYVSFLVWPHESFPSFLHVLCYLCSRVDQRGRLGIRHLFQLGFRVWIPIINDMPISRISSEPRHFRSMSIIRKYLKIFIQ